MELTQATLQTITSLAAAFSATVAGLGLLVNARATRQARQTRELQLFEHIFSDIRTLDEKLHIAARSGTSREDLVGWRSHFLNTLEYLSFLVNRRYLRDKHLVEFFSEALVRWYQDIFLAQATDEERSDLAIYPEFRFLCRRLAGAAMLPRINPASSQSVR
jgi:hypothetical protein